MIVAAFVLAGAGCGDSGNESGSKAKDGTKDTAAQSSEQSTGVTDCDTMSRQGDDVHLPAEWPKEISFPEGTELGFVYSTEKCQTMDVSAQLSDGDGKEILAYFQSQLTELGYTIGSPEIVEKSEDNNKYTADFTATNADRKIEVQIGEPGTGLATIQLIITQNS